MQSSAAIPAPRIARTKPTPPLRRASLTVTKVQDGQDGWWEVMLIPYTQENQMKISEDKRRNKEENKGKFKI